MASNETNEEAIERCQIMKTSFKNSFVYCIDKLDIMKILKKKLFYISLAVILLTYLIKDIFPHQVIHYLLYAIGFLTMSLSYFKKLSKWS